MDGVNYMLLIEQLKKHEGLRLKLYKDTVGKNTIGFGRNLDDVGISLIEAEMMLKNDLMKTEILIKNKFKWFSEIDAVRQAVVLNMVFNLGINGFSKFKKLIQAIETKDWNLAGNEMINSNWAKQVGQRASELSAQMKSGNFQLF